MTIDTKLIDELLKDYELPEDVLGDNDILKQFTQAILERDASRDDYASRLPSARAERRELRQLT